MVKIAIFGEYASDNLGDRLIGACMKHIFSNDSDERIVDIFDWKTFEKFVDAKSARSSIRLSSRIAGKIANLLPKTLSWRFIYLASKFRFQRIIRDHEMVVVGGGQLLMDNSLIFPSRLYALVKAAQSLNKSLTIVGVGVGESWSVIGLELLKKSICNAAVSKVTVRDSASLVKLGLLVPEMKYKVDRSYDAAFFSKEVFGDINPKYSNLGRIGVGVINPAAIHRHSEGEYLGSPEAFDFWLQLLVVLTEAGNKVSIFTNGELGDYLFAKSIYNRFVVEYPSQSHCLIIEKRPLSLISLVNTVGRYRAVIAARMHSNILAMSFGIPAYALAWDKKISNLYHDVGLGEYVSSETFDVDEIFIKLKFLESKFSEFEKVKVNRIKENISERYLNAFPNEIEYLGFDNRRNVRNLSK